MLCFGVSAQNSPVGEYDDQDAYEIYSLLLPTEKSHGLANGTLVIQQETITSVKLDDSCRKPQVASEFKDAREDYNRHNEPMHLQRKFNIDKPYELVNTETIGALIKDDNWGDFYKRYVDSGRIIRVSAVGFNRQRTLAIVNTRTTPNLGPGSFSFVKKIERKWKVVTGVVCFKAA